MHLYLYCVDMSLPLYMVTTGLQSGTPSSAAVNVLFIPSATAARGIHVCNHVCTCKAGLIPGSPFTRSHYYWLATNRGTHVPHGLYHHTHTKWWSHQKCGIFQANKQSCVNYCAYPRICSSFWLIWHTCQWAYAIMICPSCVIVTVCQYWPDFLSPNP